MSIVKLTGTASDYDGSDLFGLIDADDGRLLFFSLSSAEPDVWRLFHIGPRVTFKNEPRRIDRAIDPVPIGEVAKGARLQAPASPVRQMPTIRISTDGNNNFKM